MGVWCYVVEAASRSGIPDVVGVYKGMFIGLECKRSESEHPTMLQFHCIKRIQEAGGFAMVVYPENMDRALALILQRYDNITQIQPASS